MVKGITSVAAIVILLLMTVSSSGAAFYWLYLLQDTVDTDGGFEIEEYGPSESEVVTLAANYNRDIKSLTMFFKNEGEVPIPIFSRSKVPTTIWILKDAEQNIICAADWSGNNNGPICSEGCNAGEVLDAGETKKVLLENLGVEGLCDIHSRPEDSVLLFSIDFAGEAETTGSFVR